MQQDTEWFQLLQGEFQQRYFKNLETFLKQEYTESIIYPEKKNIFRALELIDYSKVSCLLLGQDPYHGPKQANGLCFAVNSGTKTPPSLQNIFTEIRKEYDYVPDSTSLTGWARQGVLLLNSVLTVEDGKPNSHQNMGWERLTDKIISLLNERPQPMAFLLWGRSARNKRTLITESRHLVLEAAHPSPLSAYQGFFGCGHFQKVNQWLATQNQPTINWKKSGAEND